MSTWSVDYEGTKLGHVQAENEKEALDAAVPLADEFGLTDDQQADLRVFEVC
jgi:hypothetical protein